MSDLVRLVYFSRALIDTCDRAEVRGLVAASARRNGPAGLTGALSVSDDAFIQVLEGPRHAVSTTLARIVRDPRHDDLVIADHRETGVRLFPWWAMAAPCDAGRVEGPALSYGRLSAMTAAEICMAMARFELDTRASAPVAINIVDPVVVV